LADSQSILGRCGFISQQRPIIPFASETQFPASMKVIHWRPTA
jgi:hypothetical protein